MEEESTSFMGWSIKQTNISILNCNNLIEIFKKIKFNKDELLQLLKKCKCKINLNILNILIKYQKIDNITLENILNNENKINFENLIYEIKFSEKFLIKNINKFNLNNIFIYQNISEQFIEKYINILNENNWKNIVIFQNLSENFIEKYNNILSKDNWKFISQYQQLSEKFIKKYFDKLDKYNISYSQNLSENFIEKYFNQLNLNIIIENQNLSKKFIDKYNIENYNLLYIEHYFFRNSSLKIYKKYPCKIYCTYYEDFFTKKELINKINNNNLLKNKINNCINNSSKNLIDKLKRLCINCLYCMLY